ncbi:hypothetical protein NDU88_006608 [Pleurodeles waltl]|uniref:Peptidase A2 domain-containing protein n=1 Tax=Pleurodeles waltl TaxID=8319 RepID=A0AAV7TYT5_PLEWA|nr:hypothetical protein NDU88_006608 [Pleurodeles waltl]
MEDGERKPLCCADNFTRIGGVSLSVGCVDNVTLKAISATLATWTLCFVHFLATNTAEVFWVTRSGDDNVVSDRRESRPKAWFTVEGVSVELIVDTGSKYTIIPKDVFMKNWPHLELTDKDICLGGYQGEEIEILGYFSTVICFKTREAFGKVYVAESGPPILGWMHQYDLNIIVDPRGMEQILIVDDVDVNVILEEVKEVFREELGELKEIDDGGGCIILVREPQVFSRAQELISSLRALALSQWNVKGVFKNSGGVGGGEACLCSSRSNKQNLRSMFEEYDAFFITCSPLQFDINSDALLQTAFRQNSTIPKPPTLLAARHTPYTVLECSNSRERSGEIRNAARNDTAPVQSNIVTGVVSRCHV